MDGPRQCQSSEKPVIETKSDEIVGIQNIQLQRSTTCVNQGFRMTIAYRDDYTTKSPCQNSIRLHYKPDV
eukprot:472270-Amphidinium_carterae.1